MIVFCFLYPDLIDETVPGHDSQKYVIHHFHTVNNTKHSPAVHQGYEDRMRDSFRPRYLSSGHLHLQKHYFRFQQYTF